MHRITDVRISSEENVIFLKLEQKVKKVKWRNLTGDLDVIRQLGAPGVLHFPVGRDASIFAGFLVNDSTQSQWTGTTDWIHSRTVSPTTTVALQGHRTPDLNFHLPGIGCLAVQRFRFRFHVWIV